MAKTRGQPDFCQKCNGPSSQRDEGRLYRYKGKWVCGNCLLGDDYEVSLQKESEKPRETHFAHFF